MIAQIPISVPTANTRLGQLTRLASASLGTSMPAAAGHGGPQLGEQVLMVLERGHGDRVERRALQVHQRARGRCRRRGPGPPPRPCARRPARTAIGAQHGRQIAVQAGIRGRRRMRSGSP